MYVSKPAGTQQKPPPPIEQAHTATQRGALTSSSAVAASTGARVIGATGAFGGADQTLAREISQIPRHRLGGAGSASASPSLALRLSVLSGKDIRTMLASQQLQLLSVANIASQEPEAFQAFAANRSLKSLAVGIVRHAESLVTLSRNTTLTSVDLHLNGSASAGIQHLTNLPALDALAITGLSVRLRSTDVQALCAKPLSSLGFNFMSIDAAVMDMIVSAKSADLSLSYTSPLDDSMVDALVANERISALRVVGDVVDERRALRLIGSPTLQKLTVDFDSHVPDIAGHNFRSTWVAAGKLPENLALSVLPITDDEYSVDGSDATHRSLR